MSKKKDSGEMVEWLSGEMVEWLSGKMVEWSSGKMVESIGLVNRIFK